MTSSTSSTDPMLPSLESGTSTMDTWLSPPDTWPTIACRECQAGMRVPFPPTDGLCGECRARARANACVKTRPSPEGLLAAAGAPRKYANLTRATWEQRYGRWAAHPQLQSLLDWPDRHRVDSWLLLITSRHHGDRKTGLGTAVLGEALLAGLAGRWESQSGWLRDLKATWSRGNSGETEDAVWRRAADAPILLFDDLGGIEGSRRHPASWWCSQVTNLIHHRESHRLPTIITATLADWKEVRQIHESLLSRMDVSLKIALPSSRGRRTVSGER